MIKRNMLNRNDGSNTENNPKLQFEIESQIPLPQNGEINDDAVKEESKVEGSKVDSGSISNLGLKVLALLAANNCLKNLLTRYVLTGAPKFLFSAAVIGSESTKLTLSILYILFIEKRTLRSIVDFLKADHSNTKLLVIPASIYNVQQTLEYVALSNIDASIFSVVVQSKLIMTAIFSTIILGKKLKKVQVISLTLLTVGVIMCNLKVNNVEEIEKKDGSNAFIGLVATLTIAMCSGFACVYTEKVIKKKSSNKANEELRKNHSLAYMQVQLASVSLIVMGAYGVFMDYDEIMKNGLFNNFTPTAFFNVFNSGLGGLMVAGVLKYADAVLKGYATAVSVIVTGILSKILFGTDLGILYVLGIIIVIAAVFLYNSNDLDEYMCKTKKPVKSDSV